MPTSALSGPAIAASAAAVRPAQCRPSALAGELRSVLVRATRRLRTERNSVEITDGQYSVLSVLSKHGPRTPGDLADRERVQPPSMTRTVAVLVEAGLVSRGEHPTDRRQVLVTITSAGEKSVRESRRSHDAWLAQRLAGLTMAERATLAEATEILRRIATA